MLSNQIRQCFDSQIKKENKNYEKLKYFLASDSRVRIHAHFIFGES